MASNAELWQRYKNYVCVAPSLGLTVDISRMNFPDGFFEQHKDAMKSAFDAMDKLEAGAIANADENRMVGHYWLRDAKRAPKPELVAEIENTVKAVKDFAKDVHGGTVRAANGKKFNTVLVVGIGGSALGPQFVANALGSPKDKMKVFFFDNTDPDGMDYVIDQIGVELPRTLTVVISKSGGTKETRNGMLIAQKAYQVAGLEFAKHAVAVTGVGSELDKTATSQGWLKRFPMWDWVGGRTSELSAVGLLPAALQGLDIQGMLDGARDCDRLTRSHDMKKNPAAILALMWWYAKPAVKDMVVLPYKDRLLLFSRYLQQLVMESLGKELDRKGQKVYAGLAVYGNKGSTDQHAYVQQLREGVNNFFVTFIEVLGDRADVKPRGAKDIVSAVDAAGMFVEDDVTSGDYLHGFFQGTRKALAETGRESLTITVETVSPETVGALIALFERAVGLYAELQDINAYHQPGVEAGKKAATAVIAVQRKVLAHLRGGNSGTAEQIASAIGAADEVETVYLTLRHLAANADHKVAAEGKGVDTVYKNA